MIRTTSLETSEKLKEAGFRQDTYFRHYEHPESDSFLVEPHGFIGDGLVVELCAAPTTDELLEELPRDIRDAKNKCQTPLRIYCGPGKDYSVEYHLTFNAPVAQFRHDDLCEALAQCWLWLKQNNLLEAK